MTIRTLLFLLAGLLAANASWAQSSADPTGTPPIGIEEKSDAKGPGFTGVLHIELIDSDGMEADSARMVARLRRGSLLWTFYEELAGPLYFDTDAEKAQLQEDVLAAFRDGVLDKLADDDCGNAGPGCVLVLKQADEFGLVDDGDNQHSILDVTVAFAEAPAP